MGLDSDDIIAIKQIVEHYLRDNVHTEREDDYPKILEAIADGMGWDDAITTDGDATIITHGYT